MNKAFTLFSTLILIFIFSILLINIYEVKSINSTNIIKQYSYIQAKNHLTFLNEYLLSLKDYKLLEKIEIKDNKFNIYSILKKIDTSYEAHLYVKSKIYNISVHKKLILKDSKN
jgi:competence protein ComGC